MSFKCASIIGMCHVNITINDVEYPNTCLELLENLCGDILPGLDFQKQLSLFTW